MSGVPQVNDTVSALVSVNFYLIYFQIIDDFLAPLSGFSHEKIEENSTSHFQNDSKTQGRDLAVGPLNFTH